MEFLRTATAIGVGINHSVKVTLQQDERRAPAHLLLKNISTIGIARAQEAKPATRLQQDDCREYENMPRKYRNGLGWKMTPL